MPAYSFEALDANGQTRKGVIDADTAKAARGLLRAQALVPLAVESVSGSVAADGTQAATGFGRQVLWARPVFNTTGLAIWTRQIAGLVAAGLPLERALTALADEAEDEKQRNLVAALRAEVNAGSSFAKALAQHPREFSEIYCAVIGAGEQSGSLGLVLQVAAVFAGTKRTLPFLTVAMLAISSFVRTYGWLVLIALVLIAIGARFALANEVFRQKFDAAWLQIPLIGRLARGYNAARFTSTLAMLASAGVPILKALQAAAETLGNRAMRADALDALVLVREGAPLASAMAQKKRFPGLVAMFARLGEQTGQLPLMLQRASVQLSAEVQRRAMALATLLEPLLIVTMGLVVMLIVLAVLLPIIQLNQLMK